MNSVVAFRHSARCDCDILLPQRFPRKTFLLSRTALGAAGSPASIGDGPRLQKQVVSGDTAPVEVLDT